MNTQRVGYEHLEFWKGDPRPWNMYGGAGCALILLVGISLNNVFPVANFLIELDFFLAASWLLFCLYMKYRARL